MYAVKHSKALQSVVKFIRFVFVNIASLNAATLPLNYVQLELDMNIGWPVTKCRYHNNTYIQHTEVFLSDTEAPTTKEYSETCIHTSVFKIEKNTLYFLYSEQHNITVKKQAHSYRLQLTDWVDYMLYPS